MALFSKSGVVAAIALISVVSLASALAANTTQSMAVANGDTERVTGVCAETNPGDEKITLECPPGTIIKKMKSAAWGQNPGSCPSVRRHSKCTLDISDFMERYCIQSNKCPVTVKKEILGYPVDKQGKECQPEEDVPFTFVASFYCGIAGWNDVAPTNSANADPMMTDSSMTGMDGGNDTMATPAPESGSKPGRNSATTATTTTVAALLAAAVVLVLMA